MIWNKKFIVLGLFDPCICIALYDNYIALYDNYIALYDNYIALNDKVLKKF
jgi:hypothetical protein